MEHAVVMVQKLMDAEVERLCCRQDSIKQETAAEDRVQGDGPSSGRHLKKIYIKSEVPDAELEAVTVKDEPIDWHQEPQASSSPGSHAFTFKREVDDDCTDAGSGHSGAEDKLSLSSFGACNTSPAHQRPAGASQGSADALPSDVSGSGRGVEAAPPDRLMSRPLLCEHCDYSTGRRDLMKLHLRVRHAMGCYYECDLCDYFTMYISTLKQHVVEQHDDENLCKGLSESYRYPGVKMRGENRLERHGQKGLECGFCGSLLVIKRCSEPPKKSLLNSTRVFKCEICKYSSTNETIFKLRPSGKRKIAQLYLRKLCEFSSGRQEVEIHQASNHGKGQLFRCGFCDYSHTRKYCLELHQASKHGEGKLLQCEFCDYSNARKEHVKRHQATKHGKGQMFKCQLCDYSTARRDCYRRHQAGKHGKGQMFKCQLCDYSTARRDCYRIHQAGKHGKGQLFRCELCDYYTGRKSDMKKHRGSKHGQGKLFKCELCDYSSTRKECVKQHLVSKHDKGQQFRCEFCDYSSANRRHISLHLASKHGDGRRFNCELCDYSSARKYEVKIHRAHKHGKGHLFKCELCGYSSARKNGIEVHRASKHSKG